jgi:hypothetical protein
MTNYEIVLASTGDRVEAESGPAALVAAHTLAKEAGEGIYGAQSVLQRTLYIARDGAYDGLLTSLAREGYRP